MRTRVKICGITREQDAHAAAQAGADALGFVFYEASPRAVTAVQARAIVDSLAPFVTTVGLFVDASVSQVQSVLDQCPLDLLQFHGQEPPEYCRQFGRPYLKALRMQPDMDVAAQAEAYRDARGLLLDSYHPAQAGGTGETFDWRRIPTALPLPLVLAGGLNPESVAQAIAAVRPWAVDVSSGVEKEKGIKDSAKIAAFIRAVGTGAGD